MKTPESSIGSLFPSLAIPDFKPRFNIAPTQNVACVRLDQSASAEIVGLRWGLVPFWAKDLKIGARMINARSETVDTKPAFRAAFKKRRCLVIADGYFEWKKIGKEKQPFYMTTAGGECFAMAGLWESWHDKENDSRVETCTVLTTDANPKLSEVHDRMPVVLDSENFEYWLDPGFEAAETLKSMLVSKCVDFFDVTPVDKTVNNVRNDNEMCVQPVNL